MRRLPKQEMHQMRKGNKMTLKEHNEIMMKYAKKWDKRLQKFGELEYQRGWNDGRWARKQSKRL